MVLYFMISLTQTPLPMAKKQLNITELITDAERIELNKNTSYLKSYPVFIDFFAQKQRLNTADLIIGSHLVYGWMPTILSLELENSDTVVSILNRSKHSKELLSEADLTTLKACINNSLVGASKLLHFIQPDIYPIWDSRVLRYWTKNKSTYGIDQVPKYLELITQMNEIIQLDEFSSIYDTISSKIDYPITKLRALELVMFESEKEN